MIEKIVKVGIIGCGGIASMKHIASLTKLDNVKIAALFDTKKEYAIKVIKDFNLEDSKLCSSIDEIYNDDSIEAVNICSPNNTHASLTIKALEAGKHVLCEKPMAVHLSDAKRMVEKAKKTGKKFSVSYQNRFREDAQYLKKICERGDLGEIYFAKAHALKRRGVPVWLLKDADSQGGGPLIDLGGHAIDLTLWLMNNYKPKYVCGQIFHKLNARRNEANIWGSWDPEKFTVEDSAFGFLVMQNGATIILESSWALNTLQEGEAMTSLCGTKCGAEMNYKFLQEYDEVLINGSDLGKLFVKKLSFENKYKEIYKGGIEEAKSWIGCITNDIEPVVKPEEALLVAEILDAVTQSAKIGKPVYFDK